MTTRLHSRCRKVMFRSLTARSIVPAPPSFDGELEELCATYIEPNLPSAEEVEYQHRRLLDYCRQPDPLFVARAVGKLDRRDIYTTRVGTRFKPSDNSPAWWMHFVAFNGIRDADFPTMPSHMHDVTRVLGTSRHISHAGFYVAHILNAKDRHVDWQNWSKEDLARRFIRNVHPCNCFYVPKIRGAHFGEHPAIIGFFATMYARRYASVWAEFLDAARGVQPSRGECPRYVYGPTPALVAAAPAGAGIAASYRFSRLCFKADVIEPLAMDDTFEVVTPEGTFRMTKADFYRDFSNVPQTASYRDSRTSR